MVRPVSVCLFLVWWGTTVARAEPALPASLRGVSFDQKLNEQVPLDLEFKDESGHPVKLGDYFNDKPVILNLAYFKCPMLCDMVMNGMVRAMLDLSLDLGKDYRVVTVSFDPRETPVMAAAKRETYLQRYGRDGAGDGWHFLTGAEKAIQRLTDAVGFRYRYDPRNDQFAHASGIVVLTPGGKVSRYFYDVRFSPRDLRLGLVEASAGRVGSTVDQVLLFCFHYDPLEGKYGPTVMNFVRLGGVLTVLGIGTFMVWLWRAERRAKKRCGAGRPVSAASLPEGLRPAAASAEPAK